MDGRVENLLRKARVDRIEMQERGMCREDVVAVRFDENGIPWHDNC